MRRECLLQLKRDTMFKENCDKDSPTSFASTCSCLHFFSPPPSSNKFFAPRPHVVEGIKALCPLSALHVGLGALTYANCGRKQRKRIFRRVSQIQQVMQR